MTESVMGACGDPLDGFDARFETLTVAHGEVARHYRAGHELPRRQPAGRAPTETLRQATVHLEELFGELAGDLPAPRK